jgi:hypothetical protein
MNDGMTASGDAGYGRGPARLARDYEHDETDGERADVGHWLHSPIIPPHRAALVGKGLAVGSIA